MDSIWAALRNEAAFLPFPAVLFMHMVELAIEAYEVNDWKPYAVQQLIKIIYGKENVYDFEQ